MFRALFRALAGAAAPERKAGFPITRTARIPVDEGSEPSAGYVCQDPELSCSTRPL